MDFGLKALAGLTMIGGASLYATYAAGAYMATDSAYAAATGHTMVTGLDSSGRQGIDGIYHNPNGHPPFIVAEAKYGTSRLNKGLADGTDQMDMEWIDNRLDSTVDRTHARAIRRALFSSNGDLQSHLFNVKKNGNIVVSQLDEVAKKMK